ncbi:tetratricopeptide repeat protein [Aquabacterium sp.]|uniref:tetratricopeptide repeat protein n=1 Tax=Aquabacterium sp. TaxID=1872578 RepID=UPI002B867CC0|nr:tetratricopeptide repeat protein [Aquabacterium sp.]HSW07262.1 tetratricopeptide repeat protein [Aquabacterium sp.]
MSSPRFTSRHSVKAAVLAAALGLAASDASAQVFKDAALNALYSAERLAELDQLALKRLAAHADDAQAVLATALVAMISNDSARREAAIQRAEHCLQQAPQAAPCHYALGSVLGIQAMSQGAMKMLSSVGRVKSALVKALELEPQWYTARSAVVDFYLLVPGLAGGSPKKAADIARAAERPEQARALEARVALKEERFDAAVALLADVKPGADTAVADDLQALWISAGIGLLGKGQREQARAVFQRLSKDRPDQAAGPYGLARVETEAGAWAEAVALLERSAQLKGAERLPVDYRLGIALQGLGRSDAARAAYQRFIAGGRGSRNALDDAKKRLTQLG